MSYNKFILFYSFLALMQCDIVAACHNRTCPSFVSDQIGADAGLNAVNKLGEIVGSKNLENIGKNFGQAVAKEIVNSGCLENAGQNLGLGTLTAVCGAITLTGKSASAAVVSGGAKILVCGKVAGAAIVASPATPYILVGVGVVVVGYGGYKVYRYYNPTTGDIIEKNIEIAQLDESKARALKAKAELYNATVLEATAKRMMEQNMATAAAA